MARLASLLPRMTVETTLDHGMDTDWVEAIAFAWMGRETLAGCPGNLPAATGARGPRILGAIYPVSRRMSLSEWSVSRDRRESS